MDRGAWRAPVHGIARNTLTFLIKDTDMVRASPFPLLAVLKEDMVSRAAAALLKPRGNKKSPLDKSRISLGP